MPRAPVVLFDATPMLDTSGQRGIGRVIQDLLHGLAETRDEWRSSLEVMAIFDLGFRGDALYTDDLRAAAVATEAARGTAIDHAVWPRRLGLRGAARHARAAMVHLPEARGTPWALPCRSLVTCHDLIPLRFSRDYLGGAYARMKRKAIELRRFHHATRIAAISRKTKDELRELLGIAPTKIDVVPNGIDLSRWSPAPLADDRARLGALDVGRRPYLLYVGYCDARKGISAMLRALVELPPIELVWAGNLLPNDVERIRAEATALGVVERVRLLGFVRDDRDLAALYRGALCHLFLSKLEGFGLSVAEALASGCPVVLVRGSGADEVAEDAALAVDPDDSAAAAAAVRSLERDPSLRARLVARGLSRVRLFDRRAMARGYVEAYRRTLSGSASST